MSGGRDVIRLEAVVVERLRENLFLVELANGHRLHGFLAGHHRNLKNDVERAHEVVLEVTPYDLSRGRIVEARSGEKKT